MFDRDIIQHGKEFLADLSNHKYEVADDGLFLPASKVFLRGEYEDDYGVTPNLIPTQGMIYILNCALYSTAKLNNFYLALYSGNYTPTNALTAANFAATAGEIVSNTEGYSNATRPAWVPPAAATLDSIDNYADKSVFNIVTATQVTIRGAALLSDAVKGATSGVLISAAKYANDRVEYNGNTYSLGYRVRAQGA